jgi:hypothetical protein
VIDCLRNAWTDALFSAQGFDVEAKPEERPRSRVELEAMITTFERSGNPSLISHAEELREKLREMRDQPH